MPVRIDRSATEALADVMITAHDAVPTVVNNVAEASATVPVLIFGSDVNQMKVDNAFVPGLQFRPLSSHQQLVVIAGGGDRIAKKLFPGESIVAIHVDPLDPIPGPPLAWQTIDAIILDDPIPASFDIPKLTTLLAGGTEIAVRSSARPDSILPWESIEGGWVLRPLIAGPIGCDGNEDAYGPVMSWHPDLTSPMRLQIVLAAVLLSVGCLGCLLLPRRAALLGVVLLSTISLAAIMVWERKTASIFTALGIVTVGDRSFLQDDQWRFIASTNSSSAACDCDGETWPIFADASQVVDTKISLRWTSRSRRFVFDLPRDGKLAFITRILQPPLKAPGTAAPMQIDTPTAILAGLLYKHGHENVTEDPGPPWNSSDGAPHWPTVHLWPTN